MINVLGAGKSSYYLLEYLGKYEKEHGRELTVLDVRVDKLLEKNSPIFIL